MDNLVNFKRIGLLLRADWMENQRKVTYVVSTPLIFFVIYTLFTHFVTGGRTTGDAFYSLCMVCLFLYFCQYVNRKIHLQSGNYLLTPANNEEKFVTLVLEGFLLLTSFTVIFVPLYILLNLITDSMEWYRISQLLQVGTGDHNLMGTPAFTTSLVFLSYVRFRKHPLLIVALGFLAFILLMGVVLYIMTQISPDLSYFEQLHNNAPFVRHILDFLMNSFNLILFALTAIMLYIAYLTLKRKELK